MLKKRMRVRDGRVGLNMTPMVDIVFLLLVFFVMATKPMDVIGMVGAQVASPSPRPVASVVEITVGIRPDHYVFNGKRVSLAEMDAVLGRLASFSTQKRAMISCANDSHHQQLISVLDLFEKHGMANIGLARQ